MPIGRPSKYSDKLADEICERILEGESLRGMCSAKNMPDRKTVLRWLDERDDFAAKYARARELQADYMDDLILEAAEETTGENAAAQRVKIGAYQWRASKLKPKRYGDLLKLSGADGQGPIPVAQITAEMTPQQAAEVYSKLIG